MKAPLKNIGILFILLIFLVLVIKIGTVGYQAKDDYLFCAITSGAYSGVPSPLTVFQGYVFSSMVVFLYNHLPKGIEWYAVVVHFLYLLSYLVIAWKLLQTKLPKAVKYSALVASLAFATYLVLAPQFTILASVLCVASSVLLLGKPKVGDYVLAGVLFFLACQIRMSSVYLSFLLLSPLLFLPIRWKDWRYYVKPVFLLAMVIACIGVSKATKSIAYQTDEWKAYNQYRQQRGQLQDNMGKRAAVALFEDQMKQDEYLLLCKAALLDGQIVTADELKQCVDYVKQYMTADILLSNVAPYAKGFAKQGLPILLLWLFYLIWLSVRQRKGGDLLILLGSIAVFIGATAYCMYSSRVKERLLIDLVMALYLAAAYESYRLMEMRHLKKTACLMSLVVVCVYGWKSYDWEKTINQRLHDNQEVNGILASVDSPKIQYASIIVMDADIYHVSETPCITKYMGKGWLTNCPLHYAYYRHYDSLVNGVPILRIKGDDENIEIVENALKNYYHIETERKPLASTEYYEIFQLVSK